MTILRQLRPALLIAAFLASGLAACSKDEKSYLTAIAVSPAAPSLAPGASQQLTATGKYSDGKTQTLTGSVTWTSLDPAVASVTSGGLVTAGTLTGGTATITATQGETVGIVQVSVTGAELGLVQIRQASLQLPAAVRSRFLAIGVYRDGTERDLSTLAAASSDAPAAATAACSTAGCYVDTVAVGTAAIRVAVGGLSDSVTVEVTDATLAAIVVAPANQPKVEVGATTAFGAFGTYSDGAVVDLTEFATWSSSDGTLAAVSDAMPTKGQATGVAAGTPTIRASYGGVDSPAVPLVVADTLPDYRVSRIPFAYTAISRGEVLVSDDDASEVLPVLDPVLTFNFFGTDFTTDQIHVSTNGMLSFGAANSSTGGPATLPLAASPNGFVAVAWDDLVTQVTYEVRGVAPARELVIQWVGTSYGTNDAVELQAILHETTGEIDFLYVAPGSDYGSDTQVGIESPDGLVGTQYSSNARTLLPASAIRFSP